MTTELTGERSQLAALPLDDKVQLLTGADSWRIPGCDALGLRPMVTSDGPSRVVPRTPDGPSEVTIGRSPRASQPGIRQLSAPVSS